MSSSASTASSAILTVLTAVSLNGMKRNSTTAQDSSSLPRFISILASFWAWSTISPTSSSNRWSSSFSRSSSLKVSLMVNVFPVTSMSFFQ